MENWKDIIGYEGLYMVSDYGNVMSLNYGGNGYRKLLKPGPTSKGYLTVVLCKNKIKKTFTVHRLVCYAFIGQSDKVIDHINGIVTDNRVENLRYCSNRDNLSFRNTNKIFKSPYPCVKYDSRGVKNYRVEFSISGKRRYFGSYKTLAEAIQICAKVKSEINKK
jgi:hypothetical protein